MQRRAPSDEQEKRPSQNETARRRSKFSGERKTHAGNNAKPRNRLALRTLKEKILIWQGYGGDHKSRYINGLPENFQASDCTAQTIFAAPSPLT
jgi:hypothetical protein